MNPPTHQQIAERAHQLWLAEGCPAGRQDEHWRVAERALSSASGTSNANDQGRIAAPTPDRVAIAAAESTDENLMSPAPSPDTAIKAALPADTTTSRPSPESQPKRASSPAAPKNTPTPRAGKPNAPLVAGKR